MTRKNIAFMLVLAFILVSVPLSARAVTVGYSEILPLIYDGATGFFDGVALVRKGETLYLIDKTGREFHTLPDSSGYYHTSDSGYYAMYGDFQDGVALIQKYDWGIREYVYGLIDKTGKVLVMPKYTYISDFKDGYAFFRDPFGSTYGFIDKTGKEVIPSGKYSGIDDFCNGVAIVSVYDTASQMSLEGIVDMAGKEIVPLGKYEFYGNLTGGVIVAYKRNPATGETEWGAINTSGKEVLPLDSRYGSDTVQVYAHGDKTIATAQYYDYEQDRYVTFAVDQNGKMIVEPGRYAGILYFEGDLGVVATEVSSSNDPVGIIDITGKELIKPTRDFKMLSVLDNGYLQYSLDYVEVGVMDRTGKVLIRPAECSSILSYSPSDGVAVVNVFDENYYAGYYKLSVVDKTGKHIVTPGKYTSISPFAYGVSVVKYDYLYEQVHDSGVIDRTGKEIVPLGKYSVEPFVDGYAIVRTFNGEHHISGVIDTTGQEVVPHGTYHYIWQFSDGCALVERDDKCGFIMMDKLVPDIATAASWARDAITKSVQKGFVPDDLQSNYADIITREEFCRMAVKWVEYKTDKDIDTILTEQGKSRDPNAFSDTNDPNILAAYALGITSGTKAPTATTPGTFTPDGEFDRQQAATMIMNTCKVIGMDTANPPTSDFLDLPLADTWARAGINFVRANSIMSGTSTDPTKPMFSPKRTYTRQESIMTFFNIG